MTIDDKWYGYQSHVAFAFNLTESIATASAVAADKVSAHAAGKNLSSLTSRAEVGSVEWLLRSRIVMWDRARHRQLSAGVAPSLCNLVSMLLAKPNYSIFVGQRPPSPKQKVHASVVLAAILAVYKHMTGDYFNGVACRDEDARQLKDQLLESLNSLRASSLKTLPPKVARLVGARRVRVKPPRGSTGTFERTLFAVRRRFEFFDATESIVIRVDGTVPRAEEAVNEKTSNGGLREALEDAKRRQCEDEAAAAAIKVARVRASAASSRTFAEIIAPNGVKARRSRIAHYTLNSEGKAICPFCEKYFHVNGLGPHQKHCALRPPSEPPVLPSRRKSSNGVSGTKRKLSKATAQNGFDFGVGTSVGKHCSKYVYDANGKVQCTKCAKFYHLNGIGPHKAHCTGTLSLEVRGVESTHAPSKKKTPASRVHGGIAYVYNSEGKVLCDFCNEFFHLNGIGPHQRFCPQKRAFLVKAAAAAFAADARKKMKSKRMRKEATVTLSRIVAPSKTFAAKETKKSSLRSRSRSRSNSNNRI